MITLAQVEHARPGVNTQLDMLLVARHGKLEVQVQVPYLEITA